MFEVEKMEKEFDYSLVDNDTADFLRSCEYEMNGIAEDARVKFGGVLKRVQEKLANYHNGIFVEWYESGGLDKNDVYYSINLYEISTNLENSKRDNFLNAPKTLQKEVMKKNAPEELKEQVLNGDITSNKEYQEMKRKLKESEQAKRQAEQQANQAKKSEEIALKKLEEEQSKEPKVIEKEVKVDNTDYERIRFLEERERILEEKLDLYKSDVGEYNSLKEQLNKLYSEKDSAYKQMETATSLSAYVVDIEHLINNKLAPVKYIAELTDSKKNKTAMKNLNKIVELVDVWCTDLKKYIDEESEIIDVDVL